MISTVAKTGNKEKALTRLAMYWKVPKISNGKTYKYILWYSLDKKRDRERNDKLLGIRGLERRIVKSEKWLGQYNCCILYDNVTDEELWRYDQFGEKYYAK